MCVLSVCCCDKPALDWQSVFLVMFCVFWLNAEGCLHAAEPTWSGTDLLRFLSTVMSAQKEFLIHKTIAALVVRYIRQFPRCALFFVGDFLPGHTSQLHFPFVTF